MKKRQLRLPFPRRRKTDKTDKTDKTNKRRGRPPGTKGLERHRERPRFVRTRVFHVRLRLRSDVPSLRKAALAKVLRRSFVRCCKKAGFRVCQYSIQRTHIHLIVEASHHEALARGMQGLAISVAKGINQCSGRRGTVFLERYRATHVRCAKQMRHALAYVLHNARRHGHCLRGADPLSSAAYFDGWARPTGLSPPEGFGAPVAAARTHLLAERWRWVGLISPDETPGKPTG